MIPYAVNKLKSVKTDKNQEPDTKHRVILKKLGDRGYLRKSISIPLANKMP